MRKAAGVQGRPTMVIASITPASNQRVPDMQPPRTNQRTFINRRIGVSPGRASALVALILAQTGGRVQSCPCSPGPGEGKGRFTRRFARGVETPFDDQTASVAV